VVGGHAQLAQAAVKMFLDGGWKVTIIDQKESPSLVMGVRAFLADITVESEVDRALDEVIRASGPVTAVVFFARYESKPGSVESLEQWHKTIEVGMRAPQMILRKLVDVPSNRNLLTSGVLIGSVLGRLVSLNQTASYHAVKSGIEGLTRYLSCVFLPFQVRVNAVSPGFITDKWASTRATKSSRTDEALALALETVPEIRAAEIASVCAFLCSNDSTAVNGQVIVADGGYSNFEQLGLLYEHYHSQHQTKWR
jgi:NAD(P)-dependent dehydrogenase (short-subunit alcohol dehydrogenase family)